MLKREQAKTSEFVLRLEDNPYFMQNSLEDRKQKTDYLGDFVRLVHLIPKSDKSS